MKHIVPSTLACALAFLGGCREPANREPQAPGSDKDATVRSFTDSFGVRLIRTRLDDQAMRVSIRQDSTYKIEVRQPLDLSPDDAKNFKRAVPEITTELFRKLALGRSKEKLKPRWIQLGDHWFYGIVDKGAAPEKWSGVIVVGGKIAIVGLWLPKEDDRLSTWRRSLLHIVQTLRTSQSERHDRGSHRPFVTHPGARSFAGPATEFGGCTTT